MIKFFSKQEGGLLIQVIVFGAIAIVFLGGFSSWAISNIKSSRMALDRERAIQIAEAGVDYYRWHLAHAPTDFQDGTGAQGPYIHSFQDKDGNAIGEFSLEITPPPIGSTIVKVESTSRLLSNPNISRTILATFAKPSFAKYAWVLDSSVNFGSAAEVYGPVHSNKGLRFDGLAHNIVSSAVVSYDDPSHSGPVEYGVHTHDSPIDPLPPAALPSRADIFEAGRQVGVPPVDFPGLTTDLLDLQATAIADNSNYAPSGAQGYHIILQTDDRYDIYRVNSVVTIGSCTDQSNPLQSGWGIWSINTVGGSETLVAADVSFPPNGVIFVEDNLWVNGQINTARLTIAAGITSGSKNIIVNNDLLYTNYDGQDVLGLIAQNNFIVGLRSDNDLRIDAAMIAQNGRVGRFNYNDSDCGSYRNRSLLTTYGMLGSFLQSAFWYGSSGYSSRVYIYDANLLYAPPPSFPLTSDQYVTISWEEI